MRGGVEALSGAQKVSVLLLAVGEDRAARLLSLLDQEEVLEISRALAGLGPVDAAVVEALLEDFRQRLGAPAGVAGSLPVAEKLLARSLGNERVGPVLAAIRGPEARSVWQALGGIDDAVLASYLAGEHPQVAAVIVSRLGPEQAARVLAKLPEDLASDVVLRCVRLGSIKEDVVADIERALEAELSASLAPRGPDGPGRVAAIFNHLDRGTETRLMEALESLNPEAAERVRSLMFTFADLGRLEAAGVQTLIRAAGNDRLALALKGAEEPLRELFFANMSERGAKMLREEIQALGPVRLKDVAEAQQFLVNLAKELAATGQIVLRGAGEEEELVY